MTCTNNFASENQEYYFNTLETVLEGDYRYFDFEQYSDINNFTWFNAVDTDTPSYVNASMIEGQVFIQVCVDMREQLHRVSGYIESMSQEDDVYRITLTNGIQLKLRFFNRPWEQHLAGY